MTLTAVARCSCNSSKAGIGVVARKNVFARFRGPPVPGVDPELFQGGGSTNAKGMIPLLRAHRGRILEGATVANCLTPIARGRIGVARLYHELFARDVKQNKKMDRSEREQEREPERAK